MIKPMLAHKFDESRIDWNDKVFLQPKLDGVRCLFTKDGAFSRTGKQFMNVQHLEDALKVFFDVNPNAILDGELYNHRLKDDFEKIISLVRKQKPTDADKDNAQELVQFHLYDYIDGTDKSYEERYNMLAKYLGDHAWMFYGIRLVQTNVLRHLDHAKFLHERMLKHGYEGSIIRQNTPYVHKRSFGLMKMKDFSDTEATIIDYEPGKGKRTGTLGKFIMMDSEGVKFGCPPGKGYTHDHLKLMLKNVNDYIGKKATFTYFQRTKAGSYRHPHFKGLRDYE
jgi:DNA ligase-1